MAEAHRQKAKCILHSYLIFFLKRQALFFIQAKYFVIIPLDKESTDVFLRQKFLYKAQVIRASGYVWASNGPISPSGSQFYCSIVSSSVFPVLM